MVSPQLSFLPRGEFVKDVPSLLTFSWWPSMSSPFAFRMNSNNPTCRVSNWDLTVPLLFADDLILCDAATLHEASTIHRIMQDFFNSSGQTPSLHKSSILLSKNVDSHTKAQIKEIFLVPNLLPNTLHLSHPIIFNHNDRNPIILLTGASSPMLLMILLTIKTLYLLLFLRPNTFLTTLSGLLIMLDPGPFFGHLSCR